MNKKRFIKNIFTIALCALLVSILSVPVVADVISVDFGTSNSGFVPVSGDIDLGKYGLSFITNTTTPWNALMLGDGGTGRPPVVSGPLTTMEGTPTAYDVKLKVGYEDLGETLWVNTREGHDMVRVGTGETVHFKFTGLLPQKAYDINCMGFSHYATFTIGGSGGRTGYSTGSKVFSDVTADNFGEIEGRFNVGAGGSLGYFGRAQIRGQFDDPMNGYPSGGINVDPANPLALSWTNLTPNVGTDVYVDVWFGTDPSDPNAFTKVVDANTVPSEGLNLTSVDVDASGDPQRYFWRVDSYVDGSDLITDANKVEGVLYNFVAVSDLAPTNVDAGVDMITWVNEPVDLLGSFTDDGVSTVIVTWSADDPNAVFTPGGATSNFIAPEVSTDHAAGPVTVTLTVQDAASEPVTDTVTINVHEDACKAGVAAGLSTIYPGDFDADCITGVLDLSLMAESWLKDTQLTAPVAK